jgi:peptide/nickel transport system substrate-binding protein
LRDGVKWSDGQPLTSADVVYSFNRILNATTVVFTVKRPSPVMLHLYVYIIPEHIWKNISETKVKSFANEPTPGSPTVGAGAYLVVERKTGQFVRMVANPNYFGGAPHVTNLVLRIYTNGDALGQALKKGEVDYADQLDPNVYNSLGNVSGVTRVAATYSGFDEFAFNTGAALKDGTPIGNGNPLLKDAKLRQALAWAVDRKALVDRVYNGYGTPGTTVIPPIYSSIHWTPPTSDLVGYDPVKAGSMLDAAGYKKGADGIRTAPNGKRLSFRLFGRSDSESSKKAIEYLQGYLTQVGVGSTVKLVDSSALTEIIGQGNYDIFEWGWVVEPDPNYQLSTFTCGKRSYKDSGTIYADLSDSFYCNPTYDQLFNQQAGETDSAKRAAIVQQMQQILYMDAPYIIYANYDDTFAYRSDRWTGFVAQPETNGAYLFQYGTWSYPNIRPVSAAAVSAKGMNLGLVGGGAVLALLIIGGAIVLVRRRGAATSDDRE